MSVEDAVESIRTTGDWIRSADTKAGIVGAFTAAQAAGLLLDSGAIARAIRAAGTAHGLVACAVFVMATTALSTAVFFVFRTIWPNISEPDEPNRRAFPSVASSTAPGFGNDHDARLAQAQCQHKILSRIAVAKYRRLQKAIVALGVEFVLLIIWRIVSSTLT